MPRFWLPRNSRQQPFTDFAGKRIIFCYRRGLRAKVRFCASKVSLVKTPILVGLGGFIHVPWNSMKASQCKFPIPMHGLWTLHICIPGISSYIKSWQLNYVTIFNGENYEYNSQEIPLCTLLKKSNSGRLLLCLLRSWGQTTTPPSRRLWGSFRGGCGCGFDAVFNVGWKELVCILGGLYGG